MILDMRKLEPHRQIQVTTESLVPILQKYEIDDFTFMPINGGIENTSVRIETTDRTYVLRIYSRQRKSDEDIALEIEFQDFLRNRGIPIPEIVHTADGMAFTVVQEDRSRWQAVLMELVDGQSVTTRASGNLLSDLAALQARMHLFGVEFAAGSSRPKRAWTDLRDSLADRIDTSTIVDQPTLDLLDRIKKYTFPLPPDLPYGYNHLDIDLDGNVITRGDKVAAIVDFDDVQYSPVVVCLGYTLWCLLDDEGEAAMWSYLQAYENIRPLTDREREVLPHVVIFRNYVLAAMRLLLKRDTMDIQKSLRLERDIPSIFLRHMR